MKTITEYISADERKNDEIYTKAKDILINGGLVAFPTETVYGLGADALNPAACRKIYEAKGRPSDNPLIVHTLSVEEVRRIAELDERALALAEAFWPGPLTLVLKKHSCVPGEVTGGLETVAVRVPAHPVARDLLKNCDMFIAAPSANISGSPSPTEAAHVISDMDGRIDMIIADDSVDVGLESTVLDMTCELPVILRPGAVTKEDIETVLGVAVAFAKDEVQDGGPKAPGMKYKHYAPKAEMVLVCGKQDKMRKTISKMAHRSVSSGKKTFIIAGGETAAIYTDGEVINMGDDIFEISARLFKTLRECDAKGAQLIISECFEEKGMGMALMNRLKKAAGNNIIRV